MLGIRIRILEPMQYTYTYTDTTGVHAPPGPRGSVAGMVRGAPPGESENALEMSDLGYSNRKNLRSSLDYVSQRGRPPREAISSVRILSHLVAQPLGVGGTGCVEEHIGRPAGWPSMT